MVSDWVDVQVPLALWPQRRRSPLKAIPLSRLVLRTRELLPRTDIEDAPRPIVDVTASPSIEVDKGSNDEPGQALEEVPTGAASPQDDGPETIH